jgi:hypothetical protein
MPRSAPGVGQFLARYKRLVVALASVAALPPLAGLVAQVGPPWPANAATSAVTLLASSCALLAVYTQTRASAAEGRLKGRVRAAAAAFGVALLGYLALKAFLCYDAPDWRHQVAGGFVTRPDIRGLLDADPGLTHGQLLEEGLYDATRVWVPWTVYGVQLAVLVTWLALILRLLRTDGLHGLAGGQKESRRGTASRQPCGAEGGGAAGRVRGRPPGLTAGQFPRAASSRTRFRVCHGG